MTTQVFDPAHARYLGEQRHGVLATIAASGFPQTKPVGFRYDPQRGTIEVSGYDMEHSAKFRNVAANPQVAFTISDVPNQDAGSAGVRFMEVRGVAEQARLDEPMIAGISPWIIRIHPRRLVSYNVAGSGGHATDLAGEAAAPKRPAAGLTGAAADRAREAVASQVAELQAGLADGDAETYNRRFAGDVMWGSPYGATVDGYDALHAIHRRLHSSGHGRSRYEIVRVLTPTPGVALAQVRRDALDEEGEPIPSHAGESRFSEMALYVLVRRGGMWWLAAGQNTVIDIDNGAVAHGLRAQAQDSTAHGHCIVAAAQPGSRPSSGSCLAALGARRSGLACVNRVLAALAAARLGHVRWVTVLSDRQDWRTGAGQSDRAAASFRRRPGRPGQAAQAGRP